MTLPQEPPPPADFRPCPDCPTPFTCTDSITCLGPELPQQPPAADFFRQSGPAPRNAA